MINIQALECMKLYTRASTKVAGHSDSSSSPVCLMRRLRLSQKTICTANSCRLAIDQAISRMVDKKESVERSGAGDTNGPWYIDRGNSGATKNQESKKVRGVKRN